MENLKSRRFSYIFLVIAAIKLAVPEELTSRSASGGETSNSDEESLFGSLDYLQKILLPHI